MTDTLWSDISEFQRPVTDAYPYSCLCIRSNDGTYLDHNFEVNYAWCKHHRASGHLFAFLVYYFYRPGVNGAHVLMGRCGAPDPRMVVMIDVESAGGQVTGNQSAQVNAEHDALAKWLGDPRRVVGYGNTSDLGVLWPTKPTGMRLVIAAYGSNPAYPGKYAHQYTDKANVAPFGPSDLNSADGMTPNDLLAMYGFPGSHPAPPPVPPPTGLSSHTYAGNTSLRDAAHNHGMSTQQVLWVTARQQAGGFDALQGPYVSAGKWDANMPAGMVLWFGPVP